MPFSQVQYRPGTDRTPQETETSSMAFTDTNNVHFPDGRLRTVDPWQDVSPANLDVLGGARSVFGHIRSDGIYYLFGTSERLYAIKNGVWYNITPFADQSYDLLGSDPLHVQSGTTTLTITQVAHGLSVADHVIIDGATDLGGVVADTYINGIDHHIATIVDVDTYTITLGTTAGSTANGGGDAVNVRTLGSAISIPNSIDTTNTSTTVTINYTAHELTDGARVKISDAVAVGGVPAGELNAEHIITYVDANSFTIEVTTAATSTVTGGGGVDIHIFKPIAGGNMDVELGAGYGMGLYGVGLYGTSKTSSTGVLKYPRIWSFDSFGDSMIMCPGDYDAGDGQKIYIWDGDVTVAPRILLNSPTDCNYTFTFNNAVVALCGNRIDVSNVGDATIWTPGVSVSAYSTDIERITRLTAGVRVGEYAVIYSENEALLMRWVNEPDYYVVEDLMDNDGLVAPNAVCAAEGVCYWMGQRGFYAFNRSGVERLTNIQNEDWILNNINNGQQWKSFAALDTKYNQVWFYFPTDTADEPSDYVIYNIGQGHWTLGVQSRTGMMRNGFIGSKLYGIYGDSASQPASVYRHFIESNMSLNIAPYAETSFGMIGEGDNKIRIRKIMPDTYQSGDINLTITTKEYPQSTTEHDADYTLLATQEYLNTRASGRVRKYRIEQNSAGAYFTMGNWKEDIKVQGKR